MKKEKNIGFIYFLAFTFLALCIFGGLGIYNSKLTGFGIINTGPISDAIKGVLDVLFNGLLEPLTTIVGGEHYELASRLILGIILYIIISFGIGKQFDKNKNDNRNGRIISLLIAILGGSLIPRDVIVKLFNPQSGIFGNFIGLIIVLIVMVLPIYLIAKTEAKSRLGHFLKGSIYLALILIITYIQGSFINESVDIGGIVSLAYGLSISFCGIGFFYGLYKTLAPTAKSAGEYIENTGGIRAQPGRAVESAKRFWRGNQPPTNQQQPFTVQHPQWGKVKYTPLPKPTNQQQPQTSNKKQIKQMVEGYYSQMQTAHVNISDEFDKPNPNIQIIKKNLEIINKYSRSIITILTESGLQGPNFDAVLSLTRSVNTTSNRLNDKDINTLKKNYKRVIGQALPNIRWPINGL